MTSHYLGAAFVYFAIGRPAVVIAILIERAGFMPQIPPSLSKINWGPTTPESVVEPGNQCELARPSSLRQMWQNKYTLCTCFLMHFAKFIALEMQCKQH